MPSRKSWEFMYAVLLDVMRQSWLVLGDMAPYLLFGFAMAGLMSVAVSPDWVERHLGGRGFRPVVKAALWGIPLPLCSCSVVPVAASMRRHGAGRAATTAFLLTTPQTGIDSIAVTYAMLGPVFAVFRPVAALVSGMLGGALVLFLGPGRRNGNGNTLADDSDLAPCTEACCDKSLPAQNFIVRAARYGLVTLPRDLAVPFLLGVVVAGAVTALMPEQSLKPSLGNGIVPILLLMAAGIPVYVCATASVPIAAGLIYLGASPGAALAFLIVGPATNPATFTTLWKVLGRRTALLYLATVAASAVICGLTLNAIFLIPAVQGWIPRAAAHVHGMESGGWWPTFWAVALLAVLAGSFLPRHGRHRHDEPVTEPAAERPECCSDCCHSSHHHEHRAT